MRYLIIVFLCNSLVAQKVNGISEGILKEDMTDILNIAASLHTDSFTFFVGTGFTRHVTNDEAPTWPELIAECAERIDSSKKLRKQLFKTRDGKIVSKHNILISAQILEQRYKQEKKNLKNEIVKVINERVNKETIDKDKLKDLKRFFKNHPDNNIITTNYDRLFSDFILPKSRVITEGSTIPKINSGQNIFHIHGSVKKPESIVATFNDYYNFINSKNYFSRKFYTLLQETTVVILGYSLDDFNLNAILNEVNTSRRESFRKSDIFYISRDEFDPLVKEFYYNTYGIKTIKIVSISRFFDSLEDRFQKAKSLMDSVKNLQAVMDGTRTYEDDFIKLQPSMHGILMQAGSLGVENDDDRFLNVLIEILNRKRNFSKESGAWEQYRHLANWLSEIACRMVIKGSSIEAQYLDLAKYSFENCSRKYLLGYSWHAYTEWNTNWFNMKVANRAMLKDLVDSGNWSKDSEIERIYIQ